MPKAPPLPEDVRAAFAAALRARIDNDKRSVERIAKAAGLSKSAIYLWLQGRNDYQAGGLYAVEHALGLDPFTIQADAKEIFQKQRKTISNSA